MRFAKTIFKDMPRLYRVLFDCLVLVTLLVLSQKCPNLGRTVTQRGFFCNDATLRYPYHEGTITKSMLYAIALYLPLLVIIFVELINYIVTVRSQRYSGSKDDDVAVTKPLTRKPLQQLYNIVSSFLLGFACERFFKALGKSTVGRLRPHFFAVCQPQLADGRTCSDPLLAGTYIEQYSCQGGADVTARMLRSVHLSFPSGHSSMSFYGMVFLALYFQYRLCHHRFGAGLLKPLLQLACLLLAWFVTLSRIMDNMHHWSDALAGCVLGSLIAVFVYFSLVGSLATKTQPKELQHYDCEKSVTCNEVLTAVQCVPIETKCSN